MKQLTILLLLSFNTFAYINAQKISEFKVENSDLKSCIKKIEQLSGLGFFYNGKELEEVNGISLNVKNVEVNDLLNTLLNKHGFTYEIVNGIIAISKVKDEKEEIKTRLIEGIVKDENNFSMPGVTVIIKGTSVGVTTDTTGYFKLTIPDKSDIILVFSFMGMRKHEVNVENQKYLTVILEEDKISLDDVVVTGYSTINKSSFTGNSVKVTRDELLKVSTGNIVDVLQVFDPSLRIMRNNEMGSDPNTLPEFYIRGRSGIGIMELDKEDISKSALSNNPNAPLFIMDGFEVTMEKVYDFDPNRIESITILKDAAATALYGSRAANGVIVIETVAPKAGKLIVTYNLTGAITAPDLSDYNLMNAAEKLEAERLAGFYESDVVSTYYNLKTEYLNKLGNVLKGVDTDWIAQPLQNEFNHKHSIYIEGGNKDIRFGVDGRYDNQNGVMKKSYRNRIGGGLTLDYRIKNLQIKNNISYDVINAKNSPYGVFSDYTKKHPYDTFKDSDGNWVKSTPLWHSGNHSTVNPLYEAKTLKNFDKNGYNELVDNLLFNWYPLGVLQIKGQISATKRDSWSEIFIDPFSEAFNYASDGIKGSLSITESKETSLNINFWGNYVASLNKNNFNLAVGINTIENKSKYTSSNYMGFPSGTLNTISFAEKIMDKPTVVENHTRLFGAFLTLNYTFDNIYLFDGSFRLDGSSEFGADKKYAPFYSLGAGINIHNYLFMRNQSLISQLKLTTTYGQLGKTNFPPYAAKHTYRISESSYASGEGVYLYYMGNNNLKWEKTITNEVKMDLGILNDLIYLKAAWYNKKTIDLITDVTIPASTGFTVYKDNLGEVQNRGFEIDIKTVIYRTKDVYVSFFGNIAHNKNKILKISESLKAYNERVDELYDGYDENSFSVKDPKYSKPFMKYVEGGSLTSIFGMKSLGINPSDGKELYVKRDGTVTQEWNASEQVILGNTEADAQGSFGLNVQYKGFSLFTTFLYEFGGQVYNSTLVEKVENVDLYNSNADRRVLTQRWQKPGDVTKLKDIKDRDKTTRPTSRFVQNYNVLTFNSLTVQYDFDSALLNKWNISMLRLSFNMKDIANISSVKQERGLSYPYARTFNFTLSAGF